MTAKNVTTRSLTRQRDFQKVYQQGRKLVGRSLVLYFLPAQDDARAVVASRKVGNAVRRNRAKRLLREMLRAVFFEEPGRSAKITACCASGAPVEDGEAPAAPEDGLWIVAVARRAILDCDIHALTAESVALVQQMLEPSAADARDPDHGERPRG